MSLVRYQQTAIHVNKVILNILLQHINSPHMVTLSLIILKQETVACDQSTIEPSLMVVVRIRVLFQIPLFTKLIGLSC